MICPPCKRAGKINQYANGHEEPDRIRIEVRYHHARCEAPTTCSCQHVVGMVLACK